MRKVQCLRSKLSEVTCDMGKVVMACGGKVVMACGAKAFCQHVLAAAAAPNAELNKQHREPVDLLSRVALHSHQIT